MREIFVTHVQMFVLNGSARVVFYSGFEIQINDRNDVLEPDMKSGFCVNKCLCRVDAER